jgi:pimeloyl-ACP methyl ester carboxylesterase
MQKSSSRNAALFETIAAQEATIENTLPSSSDELYRQKTILWTPAYFHQSAQAEGQFILETLRYNHKAFQSLCDSYLNNFDLNLIVREIKIPCLSIAGTDDRVVDIEYVRNGANMNKDITQVELKASGHFPFVEKTTEVNESILNFIKEKIR